MLAYVPNDSLYGPILLDEMIFADSAPLGSPEAVPGATTMPGVTVNVTEGNQSAVVNALPAAFQNKQYKVVWIDLSVLNLDLPILFSGTVVFAVWGDTGAGFGGMTPGTLVPDATAYIFLKFDDSAADAIPVAAGFQLSGKPFSRLLISNPIQGTKKLALLLSSDQPVDRLDTSL